MELSEKWVKDCWLVLATEEDFSDELTRLAVDISADSCISGKNVSDGGVGFGFNTIATEGKFTALLGSGCGGVVVKEGTEMVCSTGSSSHAKNRVHRFRSTVC